MIPQCSELGRDKAMALDKATIEKKDLYDIGEMPPLGHVPENMHAWAIRRERQGEPDQAFQKEVVPVRKPDSHEVVVLVMAAGVNYLSLIHI